MARLRALVADDDEATCRLHQQMLEKVGYAVTGETDGGRVMELLQANSYDVVLLDLMMPDVDGLEMVAQIRETHTVLPIVIVTAHTDLQTAIDAMQSGATDFITKPVDATVLDLRIRKAIDLELTRRLAHTDGLTGLYNHRFFQQRLVYEVERAKRYETALTLMMLDIDHFKDFNDAHGHPKGDAVLLEIGRVLLRASRASDTVARYGGEEFAIILPETSTETAGVLAERVRELITEGKKELTVSVGIASLGAEDEPKTLLEAADRALYRAKREGRDRVCVGATGL